MVNCDQEVSCPNKSTTCYPSSVGSSDRVLSKVPPLALKLLLLLPSASRTIWYLSNAHDNDYPSSMPFRCTLEHILSRNSPITPGTCVTFTHFPLAQFLLCSLWGEIHLPSIVSSSPSVEELRKEILTSAWQERDYFPLISWLKSHFYGGSTVNNSCCTQKVCCDQELPLSNMAAIAQKGARRTFYIMSNYTFLAPTP